MVEKINKFEQIIVDTITKLRNKSKLPDAETIFKDMQKNTATNWTIKEVEGNIDLLIALESYKISQLLKAWTRFLFRKRLTQLVTSMITMEKFQAKHLVLN